jgi:hypothetical protein
VQCIVELIKGTKITPATGGKFTSAFFDYSFKVY